MAKTTSRKTIKSNVNYKETCFLISPIGEIGSEKHEVFAEVLEYVVKPAVENSGFNLKVVRADEIKKPGSISYDRYDKVGWGSPIRHNAYAVDGRWYSNAPEIVASATGPEAARLIPEVEQAIADYRYSHRGDYRIWPGPNSNSFVAHVLRSTPDLGAILPPNATGRDYAPGLFAVDLASDWRDIHVTLGGFLGFAAGVRSGIEFHFAGLVAGLDLANPAVKIPAYGTVRLF